MKANDLLTNDHLSILLYGPVGSSKTALFSQAKDGYMMDFDNGMRTAATLDDKFSDLRKNIEFDIFVDMNPQKPRAWLDAVSKLNILAKDAASNRSKYKCIVVDSLTGMSKAIQLHIMSQTGDSFKVPQIQHWGYMVNEMEKFLTIARSINSLLLVTAHELTLELDGHDVLRPMSITKKHSTNKLTWLFDEVLYSSVRPAGAGKYKYIISGRSSSSIVARTRSGMTGELIHNDVGLRGLLDKLGYKNE